MRGLALLCAEMLQDPAERRTVLHELRAGGRDAMELSFDQVRRFAGSTVELGGTAGDVLAMSTAGLASLARDQRPTIEQHAALLPIPVPRRIA